MKMFEVMFLLLMLAGSVVLMPSAAQASSDAYEIPLKLLGEKDIDGGLSACHLAFWQHNKDPKKDRYSYLLYAPQDASDGAARAQIQIGTNYHFVVELVYGGEPIEGYGTQYLFANDDRSIRVHVELLDVAFRGNAIYFDEAKVTVVQKGKLPFTASAKGMSGCAETGAVVEPQQTAAVLARSNLPKGIQFGQETYLADMSEVPPVLKQLMQDYASDDCDVGGYFPWSGAKYVINDYYLLWQIPCFTGAYQGSGVFAVTQNPSQGWGELLTLPNPPGLEGNQNYAAMTAEALGRIGHIRTTDLNRGAGDCGIHQVFRLMDGPGEVLELELLEYREKIDCDGVADDPRSWPLAYSAN